MKTKFLCRTTLLSALAVLCLPLVAGAQTAGLRYHMESYALDTGLHSGDPAELAQHV